MRFVLPILLIAVAVTLFFTYLDPTYARVSELRAEQATYDDALDRSKELIAVRDRLLDTYNNFSRDDLRRLERLLPDHVDSVRLIIDIDSIAAQYGLRAVLVRSGGDREAGTSDATWAVLARPGNPFFEDPAVAGAVTAWPGAVMERATSWTDDYSSLFRLLARKDR